MDNNDVLWAGRLNEKPELAAFAFQASINVDEHTRSNSVVDSRLLVIDALRK